MGLSFAISKFFQFKGYKIMKDTIYAAITGAIIGAIWGIAYITSTGGF